MPRRGRNLLLLVAFAVAHGLPCSSSGGGRRSPDADGRAHVAIRAPGGHVVSVVRLKDAGPSYIPCGCSTHSPILRPVAIPTGEAATDVQARRWAAASALPPAPRPPPLA